MKRTSLLLLSAICLLLSGCASMMNKADQDFYTKGWLNPKSLDDPGQ